ncbi:NAD(P)/FAD-dependent oxidoreductase [Maritimibacter sp. DP1N21-5]|uniref:NAD(P)/FAD-dependent oxidoreductase n=1 Tax=Maritimibacter sp. DP1N21-5 TaxID=2836867 RepID=UPI001C488950|nr:FAD-dependent oxidoreductase [Maritimibacter sp. DP1N21-5]MBV7409360.1 FAD-dependent oxidoreductase [Maritimibacter sp. DP1N21-5]
MSFDAPPPMPRKIAIIGGGISGLAAAYLLGAENDVTLYEAEGRLGGHARTVMAGVGGDQPVDTGFIVFNYETYPHFTEMLGKLDVPVAKSNMSFGASVDSGRVEYSLQTLNTIFGQRRNIANPRFVSMIRDILKFNEGAEAAAQSDDITIGDLVRLMGLGDWFERHYLMPICGAIWSTPTMDVRSFPAKTLVNFFKNHSLLSWKQHQWYTIDGGSREYVRRLSADIQAKGVRLRPATPVSHVTRSPGQATVTAQGMLPETFDEVIFACHSDQALRLLADADKEETTALSAIRYQPNRAVLHRDRTQMPRRRRCWSAWTYRADSAGADTHVGVTYWMNRLQNIPETDPLFVSLNPVGEIREDTIYDDVSFDHPVFDRAALAAQSTLGTLNGTRNTWFAGAYMRHGFHEDGFASAVAVAEKMRALRTVTPGLIAAE